jgi:hypothetical protein
MNWGDVKSLAASFVHRKDIDWQMLQNLALAQINQNLAVQENEGATSVAMTPSSLSGFNAGALPIDFARPRAVFAGKGELEPTDIQGLLGRGDCHGFFAISGSKLYANEVGPLSMVYSTRTQPLVSDSDTNALSELYSTVLLYGLLCQAVQQIQDFDALQAHKGAYDDAIGEANANYALATFSAGVVSRTPYAVVRN